MLKQILMFALFVGGYLILMKWVLPKMGVPT